MSFVKLACLMTLASSLVFVAGDDGISKTVSDFDVPVMDPDDYRTIVIVAIAGWSFFVVVLISLLSGLCVERHKRFGYEAKIRKLLLDRYTKMAIPADIPQTNEFGYQRQHHM